MDLGPWKVCSTWKSEDKSPPCTVPAWLHLAINGCINLEEEKKKGKSTTDKAENENITLAFITVV